MSDGKIPTQDFPQRISLDGTEILFSQNEQHSPPEQQFTLQQVAAWIAQNTPAPVGNIKTILHTYALQASDETLLVNASKANLTVRFPNAANYLGKKYRIVCMHSNDNTFVELSSTGGGFTDGKTTQSNVFLGAAPLYQLYQSDGINWILVGK